MTVPIGVLDSGVRLNFERTDEVGSIKALVKTYDGHAVKGTTNDEGTKVLVELVEIENSTAGYKDLKTGDLGYASLEELNFLF